jgi:hypothetical protein
MNLLTLQNQSFSFSLKMTKKISGISLPSCIQILSGPGLLRIRSVVEFYLPSLR